MAASPLQSGLAPRRSPGHWLVLAGMVVAWGLLLTSYALATVTFQRILKAPETYSIWGGVVSFWEDGNTILATIVFVFSLIFPVLKLLALGLLWSRYHGHPRRQPAFVWLQFLGKWSMLDVLIIAMFVGAIRMGVLAEGRSELGVELYGLAIVTSMACTWGLERLERARHVPRPASHRLLDRAVALGFAAALAVTLCLPIFRVSTETFLNPVVNEFSVLGTTRQMLEHGELSMAGAVWIWVVLSPTLRAVLGLWVRFRPAGTRGMRWAMALDEWAMLDVFALGAAMVQIKLDQLADCDLLWGFWACLVAGVLGIADSYLLRTPPRGA